MPIFCVSDLHLCDRGYRDNFAVEGREARFYKFLDYVEAEGGQLYVLGDLFDFWQANLSRAVVAYLDLLTRLDKMQAVYVVGNHDCALSAFIGQPARTAGASILPARSASLRADHRRPAVRLPPRPRVGPLLLRPDPGTGEITAIISGMLEDRNRGPFTANHHAVEDEFVGTLESALTLWRHLTFQHGRRDEMLDGVEAYRKEAGADVVVYGHTHEAGPHRRPPFQLRLLGQDERYLCADRGGRPNRRLGMAAQQSASPVSPCAAMKPLEQYQAYPIPIAVIYYDAGFNCRGEFTLQSVKELADSIAQAGRLICPVAVQPWTREPGCEIPPDRRAPSFPGRDCVSEVDGDSGLHLRRSSDHEARMLNLVENLQRKSLNILEEAHAIKNIYPEGRQPCGQRPGS